jgi:peroxiredoxin
MPARHLARRTAAVLLLALVVLTVAPRASAAPASPAFQVKLLDSRARFDSRDRLGKRPVVVRFQASWCKVCGREAAGFGRLVERYRSRGVDFIVLHVQDTAVDVRKFMRAHRAAYPVALDPRLTIANRFGFEGTPLTVVVDAKGEIAARIEGASALTRLPRVLDDVLGSGRRR